MINNFSKKSAIEISFSWIFSILLGSFFLIFGFNFVNSYQDYKQEEFEIKFLLNLNKIIFDKSISSGIEKTKYSKINNLLEEIDLSAKCNNGFTLLEINSKLQKINNIILNDYPIFINKIEKNKGDTNYLILNNFRSSFKITPLIFIVNSKNNLIVFDKSILLKDDLEKEIKSNIYRNFNIVFDNITSDIFLSSIEGKNFDSKVFITDDKNKINFNKNENYILLGIENNEIKKFTYISENKNSSYSNFDYEKDFSILYGAMFSNQNLFECSYNKIVENFLEKISIYQKKTEFFLTLEKDEICKLEGYRKYYENINISFSNIYDEVKKNNFTNQSYIYDELNKIETQNFYLKKGFNCKTIY